MGKRGDTAGQDELGGMPAPFALNRVDLGDEVVISWGGRALFVYGRSDA